jgi:hypothetical protein
MRLGGSKIVARGFNLKDVLSGLIFILFALAFGLGSGFMPQGSAFQMGPGYFPSVVSWILGVLGVLITLGGFRKPAESLGSFPLRGFVLITGAPILFVLTAGGLGVLPAMAIVCAMGAAASRDTSLLGGVLISAGMTAFCILVFQVGLRIPATWIGPWLGGG